MGDHCVDTIDHETRTLSALARSRQGMPEQLVLRYGDFPRGIRGRREHAKIIEVSMTEDDPSLTVSCR
jgi:hypothetical protein